MVTGPPPISSARRASDRARIFSRSPGAPSAIPALLTRMSSAPKSRSTSANIRFTCPESATSAAIARPRVASLPDAIASAVAWADSWVRSFTITRAPSWAKRSAMARPMPEPAPVTRATRSLRRIAISSFAGSGRRDG